MKTPLATALRMLLILFTVLMVTPFDDAMAQDEGLKAYRKTVMAALDAHMSAIAAVVDGKVKYWHHVPDHAVGIVGTSRALLELFPEKVGKAPGKEGEAAPKKDMNKFAMAAAQFNGEAAKLVQISMAGDPTRTTAQYKTLSKAYETLQSQTN